MSYETTMPQSNGAAVIARSDGTTVALSSVETIIEKTSFLSRDFLLADSGSPSERARAQHALPHARAFLSGEYDAALCALERVSTRASREDIAAALGTLIAAFPHSQKVDLRLFGRILSADVAALEPTIFAIDAACIRLRQSCRFIPTIAEVLAAISSAESELSATERRLRRLPQVVEHAERVLADDEI